MVKKYELTDESIEHFGGTLFRIRALKDFGVVKKGDLGGFVESENNLSQFSDCWIFDNAQVYSNAMVYDNAKVCGTAKVYGKAKVYEDAKVYGNAQVFFDAKVYGKAKVYDNAKVSGDAYVYGKASVFGNAEVYGDVKVYDDAQVFGNAEVYGDASVFGNAKVFGNSLVFGSAKIFNSEIASSKDYIVFKNHWSSGRHFTYTRSNKMWCVGCFFGSGDKLVAKAYLDSQLSGDCYKAYVDFVNRLEDVNGLF